jgi:DNA-binding winged helix-turn-helix (wHTH) protein
MTSGSFRFDRFNLDPEDRQLRRDGEPVELNARYLDALTLLVREAGKLIPKDRFMDEVWRGIPVTDEALTQCIRTLRSRLGDDATNPRFIETVPKHGYRFIAPVDGTAAAMARTTSEPSHLWLLGGAGTLGGALAGALGGLVYGFAAASQPPQPGVGSLSILLVIVCITTVVGALGAAGVAFGIAASGYAPGRPPQWSIAGGALGGLIVGALVKFVGLDAFNLLLGESPGDITGPFEGVLLGAAVGVGAWLATRFHGRRMGASVAATVSGVVGLVVVLIGGKLMGGSLSLLASHFRGSRLRLDAIGGLVGESGFGPVSQAVTGALEGALFGGCVVGAMVIARRRLNPKA